MPTTTIVFNPSTDVIPNLSAEGGQERDLTSAGAIDAVRQRLGSRTGMEHVTLSVRR
jgi:hypothetical protein